MLLSPRKNGLTSLFKEVRVFKAVLFDDLLPGLVSDLSIFSSELPSAHVSQHSTQRSLTRAILALPHATHASHAAHATRHGGDDSSWSCGELDVFCLSLSQQGSLISLSLSWQGSLILLSLSLGRLGTALSLSLSLSCSPFPSLSTSAGLSLSLSLSVLTECSPSLSLSFGRALALSLCIFLGSAMHGNRRLTETSSDGVGPNRLTLQSGQNMVYQIRKQTQS